LFYKRQYGSALVLDGAVPRVEGLLDVNMGGSRGDGFQNRAFCELEAGSRRFF